MKSLALPSGAEAALQSLGFMARLKPCPFEIVSSRQLLDQKFPKKALSKSFSCNSGASRSRFPKGMTARNAKAKAEADSQGNDSKKCKCKCRSRFLRE
jgi:hypothetical protein